MYIFLFCFIDVTSYWGEPLPTYKIPNEHYARPEDSVRLYCEGFVGKYNNISNHSSMVYETTYNIVVIIVMKNNFKNQL